MKNITKYIILICLVFSVSSCVEENPIDQLGAEGFYRNTEEVNMAVIACYNGLQSTIRNEWALTELRSDNERHSMSASTSTASRNLYALDNFRVATTHPLNEEYWNATYHNIANCNTVLQYLDVVSVDSLRSQYEAEALFLRSYHYFNLVRLYGPLFIVTERVNMEQANKMARSSVDDVYTLIVGDLKNIIDNEMLPKEHNPSQIGRVDLWGAKTLLAKIYLTLGQYSEARALLKDVELNSHYGLMANYADVFSISNKMNQEIIFTIRFKAGGFGLGSPFANWFAPSSSFDAVITGSGSGFNCPTTDLFDAYEAADRRKDVTIAWTWTTPSGEPVYVGYVKKYLSPVQVIFDAENDWPILRYADVLLMLAEIENELTGPAAALPYLNKTRVRAGLAELTTAEIADRNDFRLAVENERRLELAYENHRLFDLMRTNRLNTIMKKHYDTEQIANLNTGVLTLYYGESRYESYLYEEYRSLQTWQYLLPIPYSVMTVAINATQNPGY
jgi:hypothetical protein